MQPVKQTLAKLFEGQLVYIVPTYQRLYIWNQEDQWEPLWSDVIEIANSLTNDAVSRNCKDVNVDFVEPHFLGAVVLKISGSTPDLAQKLRVIDGQQRITTLQLLVAAAAAQLQRAGLVFTSRRLKQLTLNSTDSHSTDNQRYKIDHHLYKQGDDYEQFKEIMSAATCGAATDKIQGPMSECYRFFEGAVNAYINTHKNHQETAASALATTLIMKLHVVGIYLDPHEKEHVIFETLNARGEPLTEWDKIKNYFLYKADEDPHLSQGMVFEKYLHYFDDPWWRQRTGRGIQRPRTDIFADYWLESNKKTPVAVRRVFRVFRKHIDKNSVRLNSMMDELLSDARYYKRCEEIEYKGKSRETLFHGRRLDMAIGAIWPLLLHLQRYDVNDIYRDRWFEILESYFVRRMIVGYQARSYDQVALELLKSLPVVSGKGANIPVAMVTHLQQYSESGTLWPSDTELEDAVLNRRLPQYAQRLVLTAIEKHLIPNWAGNQDVASHLHIEHIMPRGWVPEYWPLPDTDDPSRAMDDRDTAIETLGNLTLLNGRLNSSVSNAPWTTKRSAIQKSDNLFLNRQLLEVAGGQMD